MTRALYRLATNWRPYAYLAFIIGLLMVDPIARGVGVCLVEKSFQCPGEFR